MNLKKKKYVMEIPDIVKNKIITFNKNKKIVSDFEIEIWNTIFLDIDENEKLKIINRLPTGKINKQDLYFQLNLNRYLKFENNEFTLRKDVNYQDIKKIIEGFQTYSQKNYFKLIISRELEQYLIEKDMQFCISYYVI